METKPSIKTSEFWLTIALQIFFILDDAGVYNYVPAKYAGIAQAVIAGAYMISRGLAKQGITPEKPQA